VEGAIQLWEVRSIPDSPGLALPPTVPGLMPLSQPLNVAFRLITGKQIAPELYRAQIIKLSQAGATMLTDLKLDDFAAIQIQLADGTGKAIYLDGKVVGTDGIKEGFILRFSPLDEAAAAAIMRVLKEGSAS
jgi:hypothetical protein